MAKFKEVIDGMEGLSDEIKTKLLSEKFDDLKPIDEFNKVFGSLENERREHKASKDILKAFGDITPDDVKTLKEKAEAKILDSKDPADLSKLINDKLKPFQDQLLEKENKIKEMTEKFDIKNMEDKLREISKGKILPEAETDLLLRAKAVLVKSKEDGKYYGSDGTPLEDVAKILIEKNPHWAMKGAGLGAEGRTSISTTKTLDEKKAKFSEYMKQDKISPKDEVEMHKLAADIKQAEAVKT